MMIEAFSPVLQGAPGLPPEKAGPSRVTGQKRRPAQETQCFVWDFTLNADEKDDLPAPPLMIKALRQLAKHWVFGMERVSRTHYQGRVSLRKKERTKGPIVTATAGTPLERCHWTKTSTPASTGFDYMLKLQSRVAGPWKDTDPYDCTDDIEDLKGFVPDPWMQEILDRKLGPRAIGWLYDPTGGTKKSQFATWVAASGRGVTVPHFGDASKMCSFIAHQPPSKLYLVNIPKTSGSPKEIKEVNGFLERCKDGNLVDWKYMGTAKYISRPDVWVLSNELPYFAGLSADRPVVVMVNPRTDRLCRWDPKTEDKITAEWKTRQLMNPFPPILFDDFEDDESPEKKQKL